MKALALALGLAMGAMGLVAQEETTAQADAAVLRGLDKLNGQVVDIDLKVGFAVRFGSLRVELADCRYPQDNPTGEAYVFLTIYDGEEAKEPVFRGWMIASSPALNALDHFRYDIWVMRCKTPAVEEGDGG